MKPALHNLLPEHFSTHPLAPWLEALLSPPAQQWIENVDTAVSFIELGKWGFPITVSQNNWDSSYITSPYTAYVSYAIEELRELQSPALEWVLKRILQVLGIAMKGAQLNHVVMVNNWLVSTNLYPADWTGEGLAALTEQLKTTYPNHAIVFRSLTPGLHQSLLEQFRQHHYAWIPSRQVYLVDQQANLYQRRKDIRRDRSFLRNSIYQRVTRESIGSNNGDIERIYELYRMLYLEKYSWHNPVFSKKLIKHWLMSEAVYFEGLRNPDTGQLDGIIICQELDSCLTTPFLGYDTSVSIDTGLYRMLCCMILERGESMNHRQLHRSSGAARFKRNRGATAHIEYSAVYTQHLSIPKRIVWRGLSALLNRVAVPLIQRFEL